MVNLYTHKEANIRRTWFLFVFFFGLVIGLTWIFSRFYGNPVILYIGVVFSSLMALTSYWYSDKLVLRLAHAQSLEKKDHPELWNLVENLAITSGLPMPKIYLINEAAPNAFAAGRDPQHAVVAVTQGLLARLNKSELEGVLAHELSHIGNRDILVATVAVVLVGFISLLADVFTRSTFFGGFTGRRDSRGHNNGVLMIVGLVFALLAPLAATLMQLAISRRREFLADASGALLTRYPEGLASALLKISAAGEPLVAARQATAHLWFANPFETGRTLKKMRSWFSTHPPVEARVRALRGIRV